MKYTCITGQEHARLWHAQDLDNLEVLQASYTKHSFARHSHEEYLIGLIEGGGCQFCYRGDTHIAPAGSIVLINPGEAHDGSGAETSPLAYRALYPPVDALQHIASEFATRHQGLPYFTTAVVQDEQVSLLLRSLLALLEMPASALERESQFCLAFAQLIARYAERRPLVQKLGKEHHAVRLIRDYLETQYAEQITLTQLASLAGLSPYRGCSYRIWWIIPISPSDRIHARFRADPAPMTTPMPANLVRHGVFDNLIVDHLPRR